MTQAIDLSVNLCLLLDVGIRVRDVRLWLVVVVVGDKVMHRVLRKEFAILLCELGSERFVMRKHQGWLIEICDDVCRGEGLARTRNAEQRLMLKAVF